MEILFQLQQLEQNNISKDECLEPEKIYTNENETYIIYKYEDFLPISQIINKGGMDLRKFLKCAIMICNKLFILHKKDIHGAINPLNVLIKSNLKEVKFQGAIYDINSLDINKSLSIESYLMNYISPEHTGLFESYIDYKSDLYSLGTLFYKMVTGVAPFENTSKGKIVYNQAIKSPILPDEVKNNIPKSISKVIMKLLSKTKENRYETVYGVMCDLLTILKGIECGKEIDINVGEKDTPCRLNFTEKMYGRNGELNQLLQRIKK